MVQRLQNIKLLGPLTERLNKTSRDLLVRAKIKMNWVPSTRFTCRQNKCCSRFIKYFTFVAHFQIRPEMSSAFSKVNRSMLGCLINRQVITRALNSVINHLAKMERLICLNTTCTTSLNNCTYTQIKFVSHMTLLK